MCLHQRADKEFKVTNEIWRPQRLRFCGVCHKTRSSGCPSSSRKHPSLYGRRLVLEIAKEGESVEELQAKTAAQFTDSSKLSRKRKHLTILDEGNVKFQRISD